MKHRNKLLGTVGAVALAVLGANPANAAMTAADTAITNNVSVAFQVGGFNQTAAVASDTFRVDRKVAFTVAETGSSTTTVSPGQTSAVTAFTLTNNSNATLDFGLSAAQVAAAAAGAHSNVDFFDTTNVKIYVDVNGDGALDGGDTLVTYIDEIAGDGASVKILVVSDIPVSLATGKVAAVTLTATAQAGGTAATAGAVLTQTAGANTALMETVFADAAGVVAGDVARDGKHSAIDDYTVLAAALSAVKTSKVISDPVNGTTQPKAIPGAVIEYCIAVTNAAGSAPATSVTITDNLPAEVTYLAGNTFVNGTVTGSTCNADGTAGGSFAGTTVTGPLGTIAAGATTTLRFQATIK
jgi:uncharacterized repeat protein (TIGR01451 family)